MADQGEQEHLECLEVEYSLEQTKDVGVWGHTLTSYQIMATSIPPKAKTTQESYNIWKPEVVSMPPPLETSKQMVVFRGNHDVSPSN